MTELINFAKSELEAAGLFDEDSDYNGMLGCATMRLIEAFSKEGHSGASARIVLSLLSKLANFQPITPLTGEDDEWNRLEDYKGKPVWQNKRCPSVFKDEDVAYDIAGRIFKDVDGCTYTNTQSRVNILFPYTQKSEIVEMRNHD